MRIILIATLIILIAPLAAQTSIFQTLLPSLNRDNYNPYLTFKAPFAPDVKTAEIKTINTLEELQAIIPKASEVVPVSLPHASLKNVREWVINAAADALTFEGENPDAEIKDALKYFNPTGKNQYLEFLETSGINKTLKTGKYQISSIVQSPPIFIGEREDNGRYKWLFETPILISKLDINAKSYDKNSAENQQVVLKIQILRVNQTESGDHDILIELWQK